MTTTLRKNSNFIERSSPMIRQMFCWAAGLSLFGCANIDCPLDNQTEMQVHFYDAATRAEVSLSDSLTILGVKRDSTVLLYNRAYGVNSLKFPLNAASDRDTLLFRFISADGTFVDTLYVNHRRQPHFESLDCPHPSADQCASSHSPSCVVGNRQCIDRQPESSISRCRQSQSLFARC